MKRVILVGFLGIVSIAVAVPAAAADQGWSVEVDAGQSMYKKSDLHLQTGPNWYSSYDTQPSAYRLMVAYKFNRYWGIEGGYVDLGHANGDLTYSGTPVPIDTASRKMTRVDAKGWQFSGFADYPFADHWMVYGRVGVIDAKVNYSFRSNAPIPALSPDINASNTSAKATYGVGIGWSVTTQFGLKLGWDRYQSLGSSGSTGTYDIDLVSLGAQLSF